MDRGAGRTRTRSGARCKPRGCSDDRWQVTRCEPRRSRITGGRTRGTVHNALPAPPSLPDNNPTTTGQRYQDTGTGLWATKSVCSMAQRRTTTTSSKAAAAPATTTSTSTMSAAAAAAAMATGAPVPAAHAPPPPATMGDFFSGGRLTSSPLEEVPRTGVTPRNFRAAVTGGGGGGGSRLGGGARASPTDAATGHTPPAPPLVSMFAPLRGTGGGSVGASRNAAAEAAAAAVAAAAAAAPAPAHVPTPALGDADGDVHSVGGSGHESAGDDATAHSVDSGSTEVAVAAPLPPSSRDGYCDAAGAVQWAMLTDLLKVLRPGITWSNLVPPRTTLERPCHAHGVRWWQV